MRRFFIDAASAKDAAETGKINIGGSDVNHIVNVLRMRRGDALTVCSSDGREFDTVISGCGRDSVELEVKAERSIHTEPRACVTLIQGLAKGEKMDLIIQKAVELGATAIEPVITEFTVARPDEKSAEKKTERWRKIAEEAAKQCGRGAVPEVLSVRKFCEAVSGRPDGEIKIIAYENELDRTLKDVMQTLDPSKSCRICLIIGPEGGISSGEYELAVSEGFVPVSLGKRILRTETAGLAALAGIRFYFGD